MVMSYGNTYVAQVAMGANMQQTLNAIREAEASMVRVLSSATHPALTTACAAA